MIKLNKVTEDEDTFTIAVAGKGGTGKTTISGLIIRELVERQAGSVLAIDADPNANLNELLGFDVDGTIGELEAEVLRENQDIPPGMTKKRWMELHLQQILSEGKGKDLLVMGRGEGPNCYCAVNNILREYLNNLARNYDFLVMDNEAGMEHLSRRTTAGIDTLLIASDSNPIAVKSARRIAELVDELDIEVGKKYLVLNRTEGDLPDKTEKKVDELDLELLGEVPRDENVRDLCWEGKPIDLLDPNSPALKSVRKMVDDLVSYSVTISPVKSE
ncbi:AAA family ATPase [Candidatus Bipolaricaulota bacterium]|nr:AAA family ATPase [Candidatus Bipolaricaulota bacterium]